VTSAANANYPSNVKTRRSALIHELGLFRDLRMMLHATDVPKVAKAKARDAKNTPALEALVYEWSKTAPSRS
jgi:hypothetical protein